MTSEEFRDLCNNINEYDEPKQWADKITKEEIDEISNFDSFEKIKIYGLKQETFEYFVETQAHKFQAIMFWQNTNVKDWSSLSKLKNVRFIGWYNNNKIECFWDMTSNEELRGLCLDDMNKLNSLNGIEKAPKIERFNFGSRVRETVVLDDIDVLGKTKIKELQFSWKEVKKDHLHVFKEMKSLEKLDFRTNMYTTEQLAWLVANLPKVEGYALKPYIHFEGSDDVLICGKRKPFLSMKKNKKEIEKYEKEFEMLVERYKNENGGNKV